MTKKALKKAFHKAYKAGEAKDTILARLKDGKNDRIVKRIANEYPTHIVAKKYNGQHILANLGVHFLNFGSIYLVYVFFRDKILGLFSSPELLQDFIARQSGEEVAQIEELMTEFDPSEFGGFLDSAVVNKWIPIALLVMAAFWSLIIFIFHKKKSSHYISLLVLVILMALNIIPMIIANVFGTPMIISHPIISIIGIVLTIGVGYLVFDTKRKLFPKS